MRAVHSAICAAPRWVDERERASQPPAASHGGVTTPARSVLVEAANALLVHEPRLRHQGNLNDIPQYTPVQHVHSWQRENTHTHTHTHTVCKRTLRSIARDRSNGEHKRENNFLTETKKRLIASGSGAQWES